MLDKSPPTLACGTHMTYPLNDAS